MKVILSESDIHWMVRKTIANLLLEAYQTVDSIYRKYYSDIDLDTFRDLIALDPTYNPQVPDKLGNYAKWILKLYKNGLDVTEAGDLLARYDIVKRQQGNGWEYGDINRIKSLSELYDVIKPYSETKTNSERQMEIKQGAEKVYGDNDWIIVVPHTEEAAQLYGKGTKWCTAAINDNRFDYYNDEGLLYINIRRSDNAKFQFHFEEDQFMDAKNDRITSDDNDLSPLEYNGFTEPVISFYTAQGRKFPEDIIMSRNDRILLVIERLKNGANPEDVFDSVGRFHEGFAQVWKCGLGWNLINTNGQIAFKDWYDSLGGFHEGFAAVKKEGLGYNFINTNGQVAFKDWYDSVGCFSEGFAAVMKKGLGWNFINTDGQIAFKDWYESAGYFSEGFAMVLKDGLGWNFIDTDGQLLCKDGYYSVGKFSGGFAWVEKDGLGCNFINRNGQIAFKDWYDSVGCFSEGFAAVMKKGLGWNFIDTDGRLLCKDWYDWTRNFHGGFAVVKKDGLGYNFIDRKGQLLCKDWYDWADDFHEGFAMVYKDEFGYNFIDTDGRRLCDDWYNRVGDFHEGFAMVYKNEFGYNFIDTDGQLLCKNWYDDADNFDGGFAWVEKAGEALKIGRDGREYR